MKKLKALFRKYREQIFYLLFGVATTLVNYGVTVLCREGFGMSGDGEFTAANAIAWVCAVLFAFFVNKLFVFESKSFSPAVVWPEFGKFVGARVFTGLLEIFLPEQLMKLGVDFKIFGKSGYVAKLIVSVLVIVLNYVFSKLFIFVKKKNDTAGAETGESENSEKE